MIRTLLLLGILCPALVHGAPMVAFRDINLVPMTSNQVLPHQTVLVKYGRILQTGDSSKLPAPKEAIVIEGTDKYLMPGLADMHVHIGSVEWETPDVNLFLANGVTTVRDLTQGGQINSIKRWTADFNSKKRLGPTILNAWTLWGHEPHLEEALPAVKAHGYDCLKINSYFTRSEFLRVARKARETGLYSLGHVPYPVSMDDLLASGMNELSHVEELPIMLADYQRLEQVPKNQWDEEMITRMIARYETVHQDTSGAQLREMKNQLAAMIHKMAGKEMTVTTTLVCDQALSQVYNNLHAIVQRPESRYLPPRFWDDLMKGKEKNAFFRGKEWGAQMFYDMVLFSMAELRRDGIPVVAGTDSGPSYVGTVPGFSLHDELQLLVDSGYTPYEALSAATRDASKLAAKMTGRDEFGTVEPGKRADLLMLAGNPLTDVSATRKPLGVMTAGVWLPSTDLEQLLLVKRKPVLPLLREVAKTTGSADAVFAEYRRLAAANRRNDYYFDESVLTNLGYDFLNLGKIDEAIRIMKFNCEEYPESANVYDSIAEAYLKKGDRALAIENYRKALAIDPNFPSSIKALEELSRQP